MSETIMDLGYKIQCGEATPQDAIEWMKLTSNGHEIRDKAIAILEKATTRTRTRTPAPAEVEELLERYESSWWLLGYEAASHEDYEISEENWAKMNALKSRLLAALSNTTPYLSRDVSVPVNPDWEHCQRCGKRYDAVWRAPDKLWKAVTGIKDGSGLFCPSCFTAIAQGKGISVYWDACESEAWDGEG